MPAPSLGAYGGLRRCADDGGRFLVLDLGGAAGQLLHDLIDGLAPFASAVVLDRAQLPLWYRRGAPWQGRILRVRAGADLTVARRSGVDAVLADADFADPDLARLGPDPAADLGLGPRDAGPWIDVVAQDGIEPAVGAAGYLATSSFWAELHVLPGAQRRTAIADDLVPRLQALNAAMLDRTPLTWLDVKLVETTP